jgi:hypothetical protein
MWKFTAHSLGAQAHLVKPVFTLKPLFEKEEPGRFLIALIPPDATTCVILGHFVN